jgi:hypothetical protein
VVNKSFPPKSCESIWCPFTFRSLFCRAGPKVNVSGCPRWATEHAGEYLLVAVVKEPCLLEVKPFNKRTHTHLAKETAASENPRSDICPTVLDMHRTTRIQLKAKKPRGSEKPGRLRDLGTRRHRRDSEIQRGRSTGPSVRRVRESEIREICPWSP